MALGFVGGTGIEARGLALRFAAAGQAVILGSRSEERAVRAAASCNALLPSPTVLGMAIPQMLEVAGIVFLTVPFGQAVDAVQGVSSLLRPSHIVVDVTVPMIFLEGRAQYLEQGGLSNSEIIARHLPEGVPLVAAFKTIPASILATLAVPLDCDALICGDSREAKEEVMAAAASIPSLRALDGGSLQSARALEHMAVLAAGLNRRYRKKGARFRIAGI